MKLEGAARHFYQRHQRRAAWSALPALPLRDGALRDAETLGDFPLGNAGRPPVLCECVRHGAEQWHKAIFDARGFMAPCLMRAGEDRIEVRPMSKRARPKPSRPSRHFLREWREHKGWTQAELADRLGVGQDTISRYENGQRQLTIDVQAAIAEALEIRPLQLLNRPGVVSLDELMADADPATRETAVSLIEALLRSRR